MSTRFGLALAGFVTMISGVSAASGALYTVITPLNAADRPGGSAGFDSQPTYDNVNMTPVGTDAVNAFADVGDGSYGGQTRYIDLGANYADLRITEAWSRMRPFRDPVTEGAVAPT